MTNPRDEGDRIYKQIWKVHDDDWGAAVAGVIGGQGSVKTACCLDIAEKKMRIFPKEKIFWHETVGSPCQFRKMQTYPFKIFIESGARIEFIDITNHKLVQPEVHYFYNLEQLYQQSERQTLNVVFFNHNKRWTDLIQFLQNDKHAGDEWQTVIFDEMETVYYSGSDNKTDDKWWDFMKASGDVIKECRKSRVGLIGNYHNKNSVDYRVRNKFMFHLYGFGSQVAETRINQGCVDQNVPGEFWIDHQGSRFGKIKIKTVYKPPVIRWSTRYC